MHILIATNSYKEALSAIHATNIISDVIKQICPNCLISQQPLSDGGHCFEDILVNSIGGRHILCNTHNAIGNIIKTQYGIAPDNTTAIIEMAKTCALADIPIKYRNPLMTSSFGVGEQIIHAVNNGCNNIIIGLGDTGTHDMGLGLLQALKFEFFDINNTLLPIAKGGNQLNKISRINDINVDTKIKKCKFTIASDVKNSLLGKTGAAQTFAPQKGATSDMVLELEKGALNFSKVLMKHTQKNVTNIAGCGAAGGVGASMLALLNTEMASGIDLIIKHSKIEQKLKNGVDLVITGEGKLDNQSLTGKAPIEISKLCKKYNIPVIAFCGVLDDENNQLSKTFTLIKEISPRNTTKQEALKQASKNLEKAAYSVLKNYFKNKTLK